MRVTFLKDTKDMREGKKGTFLKGQTRFVGELGKKYIDKGYAFDEAGKYIKKQKEEDNG